jgi:hypothetical protein
LLGKNSVNTFRGNEYAAIEGIHCYAMDVFSVLSYPRRYNEKPTISDSSAGGVVWSEVESILEYGGNTSLRNLGQLLTYMTVSYS